MRRVAAASLLLLTGAVPLRSQQAADLMVYGRVWTGDPARPWAEAVAVLGDRISRLGA